MSQEILILLSPLMLIMFVTAFVGWSKVPDDTRFRGRLGPTGTDFTVGKRTGFGMRLASAIAIYLGVSYMAASGLSFGSALFLGALSLVVLLIGQVTAIRRASGPP